MCAVVRPPPVYCFGRAWVRLCVCLFPEHACLCERACVVRRTPGTKVWLDSIRFSYCPSQSLRGRGPLADRTR